MWKVDAHTSNKNAPSNIKAYSKNLKSEAALLPLCRRKGGEDVSSYSILTSVLDGVSGQRQARSRFIARNGPPVPIVQEAGCASELVWTQRLEEKYFASAGDRTPAFQSVIRHYTD
jgi:hypothetical protein